MGGGDAKQACRQLDSRYRRSLRGSEIVEDGCDARQENLACFGERKLARRALEKTRSKPGLERCDLTRNGRSIARFGAGGRGETSKLRDPAENPEIVCVHSCMICTNVVPLARLIKQFAWLI